MKRSEGEQKETMMNENEQIENCARTKVIKVRENVIKFRRLLIYKKRIK